MLGELVVQIVGEVLLYGTGRLVAAAFTPHIHVSRTGVDPPSSVPHRRWFALTYKRDGRRYYFESTITLLGLLAWAFFGLAAIIGFHHYRTLP